MKMTLNTTSLKQYADKLYRQMLSSGRMSDDTFEEACGRFTSRLRRYRDRHPGEVRVSHRFVKNCERWVAADLLRRRRRRQVRSALAAEAARGDNHNPWAAPETVAGILFLKLESVLRSLVARKPKAAPTVRLFLLKNAWYLPADSVRRCARLVDGKKSDFIRQVKAVRKLVAAKTAGMLREKASAAHYWHIVSLRHDIERRGRSAAASDRKTAVIEKQRRALHELSRVKLHPSVAALARVAGVTVEQARYACETCEREIKKRLQG